jgi:hypothetical protein
MTLYLDDPEWEDYVITEVERYTAKEDGSDWYTLSMREADRAVGSMGIGLSAADCDAAGVVPKAGDCLRLCGSFGRPVRGFIVNGVLVSYRTQAEERERHRLMVEEMQAKRLREFEEKGRAELDAKYAALPPIFQQRIDKFRHNNPDFRWQYEGYEMFCCTEAVKLARHLGTADAVEHYRTLAFKEQDAIDKAAGVSDDHSGNTHGAMVALAYLYLKQPDAVRQMHGALAPLVGSFQYGCIPPDEIAGDAP